MVRHDANLIFRGEIYHLCLIFFVRHLLSLYRQLTLDGCLWRLFLCWPLLRQSVLASCMPCPLVSYACVDCQMILGLCFDQTHLFSQKFCFLSLWISLAAFQSGSQSDQLRHHLLWVTSRVSTYVSMWPFWYIISTCLAGAAIIH